MIEGPAGRIFREADGGGRIGLGIAIHEKGRLFGASKAGGEIYSRGCFTHSALLICDRNDSSQIIPRQRKSSKGDSRMQDVSRGTFESGSGSVDEMFHVEHLGLLLHQVAASCSTVNQEGSRFPLAVRSVFVGQFWARSIMFHVEHHPSYALDKNNQSPTWREGERQMRISCSPPIGGVAKNEARQSVRASPKWRSSEFRADREHRSIESLVLLPPAPNRPI